MNKIILGLDPGLRCTGWSVVKNTTVGPRCLGVGVIKPESLVLQKRLADLYYQLLSVIEKYQPDIVVVEETFVNVNNKTSLHLGMARGIALLVPALKGISVYEYTPTKIKKTVSGSGVSTKNVISKRVSVITAQLFEKSSDITDATAAAICYIFLNS